MKNKLKKTGKFIIHNTFGFLIGILIAGTTVYAATVISGSNISYDNSNSTLEATNVQDALDELVSKTFQCPGTSGYLCSHDIKVGDYVQYTSSITSYTIPASLTGYTSDQTINPRELSRWRIISINNDGTVDIVSEYTSSTEVYFTGKTGYQNLVGTLNLIASQYTNSSYAIRARHMGYNGQTSFITDTSKFTSTAPWTSSTTHNGYDQYGGGDILYQKDIDLVKAAVGTLNAYKQGTTSGVNYWLASRYYMYSSSTSYNWMARRIVTDDPTLIAAYNPLYSKDLGERSYSNSIRPIVTIKADSVISEGAFSQGYNGSSASKSWILD